jgi:IS5 family transposase
LKLPAVEPIHRACSLHSAALIAFRGFDIKLPLDELEGHRAGIGRIGGRILCGGSVRPSRRATQVAAGRPHVRADTEHELTIRHLKVGRALLLGVLDLARRRRTACAAVTSRHRRHLFSRRIVDVHTTQATGTAEREAAKVMLDRRAAPRNADRAITVGADRGYDVAEFIQALQDMRMVPHVAAKTQGSAVPEQIKETEGYAVSLRRRKMIEEAFGWVKEIGTLGRVMLRGLDRLRGEVLLNFSAYNLVRLGNLLAPSH